MKHLCHVYGKTAKELCEAVNKLGVEPFAILSGGAGQRSIAFYYGEAPKKVEAKKAAAPEAEAKGVDDPKPAATKGNK